LNRHPRADDSMSSRTGRKATDGDSSDPIVTTAASSQADTVSAGQPGEALPHPARRGPEPAQPVPDRVLRHPGPGRDRPDPWPRAARASMSPITAVPSHRRASSHAGRRTCVVPHEEHRARRGRTATASRPAVKTRRRTA
jgi:hypothetical protein